jgi:hypothetical protein
MPSMFIKDVTFPDPRVGDIWCGKYFDYIIEITAVYGGKFKYIYVYNTYVTLASEQHLEFPAIWIENLVGSSLVYRDL